MTDDDAGLHLVDLPGGVPDIEGYRMVDFVGEGGMGRVYRAIRLSDDRPVAIKTIAPRVAVDSSSSFLRRFRREMAVCKEFKHPNVVTILDGGAIIVGQEQIPFFVM